jgi:uncharacterized protein (DUF433 family)
VPAFTDGKTFNRAYYDPLFHHGIPAARRDSQPIPGGAGRILGVCQFSDSVVNGSTLKTQERVGFEGCETIEVVELATLTGGRFATRTRFDRITFDPNIMGGRACIRGMRITVSLLVNLVANGMSTDEIVREYPDLEADDVRQALSYASALANEEVHLFTSPAA